MAMPCVGRAMGKVGMCGLGLCLMATGSVQPPREVAAAAVQPAMRAGRLFPLRPATAVFEITEGERDGEWVRLALRPVVGRPGIWRYDLDDERTAIIARAADGSIVLYEIDLQDSGYRLVYDTPVTLIPSDLRPGHRITESTGVAAYNIDDGSLYARGTAEHVVRDAGHARIRTPAGLFDSMLVRMEQDIDLRNAKLTIMVLNGYLPGEGRVYQHMVYEQRAYVLFGESELMAMRIAEFDEGGWGEGGGGVAPAGGR